MRYLAVFLCAALLMPAFAQAEDIEVTNAYAYATSAVQKNGAVFMSVSNHTDVADRLVLAQGTVADRVELHTHIMDGDMMMMREVEGYDLPAGGNTVLEPMGHHIMLMGLHNRLNAGEVFPLTLKFEKHAPITIDVSIKSLSGE